MYKNYKVLGLIMARGGSKSIPKKNIKLLGGKPLIAHTIEKAKMSKYIDRLILSTDDAEIARVAKGYGCEVPFMRPAELAEDNTPDYPVVAHAVEWLYKNENWQPEIIVHLRPTGPLRTSQQIDNGVELLGLNKQADSVRSVNEPNKPPYKMWTIRGKYMKPMFNSIPGVKEPFNAPRQILPKVYETNANLGVIWLKTIKRKKTIIGNKVLPLVIDDAVVDIDTEHDFFIAGALLRRNKL